MKKYKVIVSNPAKKDIRDIYSYISNDLFSPEDASNLIRLIEKKYKKFRCYAREI